ncbi:Aste57867_17889 [Aphanomyces stellatus]|uniref:Aste57867_17889 protein n=1 Tax=Aphanomyces stellatus TaxID=120398 RepID=A0A485L8N9_9STRA|nr:hypothetical protein As57867_017828 [Aphanomyces stellatus]VFT94631.1 Aste57867_17889 [Aphanomyces stellatus]
MLAAGAMTIGVGEIPLNDKRRPTASLPRDFPLFPLVSLRETGVNIEAIQERIRLLEQSMDIWNPEQQKNNVPMRRSGHDVWGIDKIMLVFCDDYMKRVYQFPWLDELIDIILPIFEKMMISLNRVVRCLFARMPPGSTIPVHNDTGYWVNKCHRVHVPIFTHELIDFEVGRDESSMVRFVFSEGNIYELNNASKHKVHNGWDQPRVHLIFDYVDSDFPIHDIPVVKLNRGEVLHQTRRTVDQSTSYGSRPPPSFVIIGAQKAGTTSLYDYITQHDLVLPAVRKETHYLDWRWNALLPSLYEPGGVDAHREQYCKFFRTDILLPNPSILSGEATPSYLLGGSIVIQRFKALMPDCKILVTLRNPIDRAFSQYNMTADPEGNPEQLRNRGHAYLVGKTFEQVVTEEIAELESLGVNPDMTFDEFDSVYMKSRLAYNHGGHSFVGRGLYALQLEGWMRAFPKANIKVINMDDMKSSAGLQRVMSGVFSFLELPEFVIQDSSAKNTRSYAPLKDETRLTLESFYAPYNAKLLSLLERPFYWN